MPRTVSPVTAKRVWRRLRPVFSTSLAIGITSSETVRLKVWRNTYNSTRNSAPESSASNLSITKSGKRMRFAAL